MQLLTIGEGDACGNGHVFDAIRTAVSGNAILDRLEVLLIVESIWNRHT